MNNPLRKLTEQRDLRNALLSIMETDAGKVFFKRFLRDCNISRPKIAKDPYTITWNESRRHIGMSYLSLMAKDDPQSLIDIIEQEQ